MGGLEGLGGAGLQPSPAQRGPVIAMALEMAVDRAQRRQLSALLGPMGVEDLDLDLGIAADLFDDPPAGLVVHDLGSSAVGTPARL